MFVDEIEIDTTGATTNQVLKFDGTKFAPGSDTGLAGTVHTSTIGDGSATSFTITHSLGTRDVVVVARNAASPYEVIDVRWEATTTATVTLDFSAAPSANSVSVGVYSAVAGSTVTIGSINDLGDVTISSAADGDFLRWNGTAWVNDAVNLSTDTIGSYVESLVAGTGVTLTNNSGEGSTPTVAVDTSVIQARVADVSDTEIGYLNGVTSAIQTQIDTKAPLASPALTGTPTAPTAAAATNTTQIATTAFVTGAVTDLIGGAPGALDTLNELAAAINDDASYASGITTALGLKAPLASPTFTGTVTVPAPVNNTDAVTKEYVDSAAAAASTLSFDNLTDATIVSAANGQFLKYNGSAWVNDAIDLATDTVGDYVANLTAGTGITLANNSGENASPTITVDTSVIQARVADVSDTEIGYLNGVTSAIQTQIDTKAPSASPTFTGTVAGITSTMVGLGNVDNTSDASKPISTATQTALDLKAPIASPTFTGTVAGITSTMVGLGNVDNTSDANKPVSTATQTALDLKATLASPTFTGTPTLPTGTIATTQTAGNNSTAVATTAFVSTAVANLVDSAPAALNTLDELAAALGDDANFATTVATNIGLKAPIASPTFTGTVTIPTGASITAPTGLVKGDVGLSNVDNTSDANKPVSTA